MSSAFLQIGSWSLNPKHVTYIRKVSRWEVMGGHRLSRLDEHPRTSRG